MKHQTTTNESRCELIQMSLSDAIDSNKTITSSEQQHIDNCPECAAFLKMWQSDSNLTSIASGVSEHYETGLSESIIANIQQNSIAKGKILNRGKIFKIAAIAATITLLTTVTFSFLNNERTETQSHELVDTANTSRVIDEINIKLQDIEINLSQKDIEKSLQKNYTHLSEVASETWVTTTSSITQVTEYLSNKTRSLSKEILPPLNDQTLNTKYPHIMLVQSLTS